MGSLCRATGYLLVLQRSWALSTCRYQQHLGWEELAGCGLQMRSWCRVTGELLVLQRSGAVLPANLGNNTANYARFITGEKGEMVQYILRPSRA